MSWFFSAGGSAAKLTAEDAEEIQKTNRKMRTERGKWRRMTIFPLCLSSASSASSAVNPYKSCHSSASKFFGDFSNSASFIVLLKRSPDKSTAGLRFGGSGFT